MSNLLDYIVFLDLNIEKAILDWRTGQFDSLFFLITFLGNWLVIGTILLFIAFVLFKYKKNSLIVPFIVSVLGSAVLTLFIKLVVGRARPIGDIVLYTERLPSFPSAHSALVFSLFGFLIYCLCRFKITKSIKTILISLSALIIFLVGFSRIYLGVHFFSDILGGYFVGLLWVLVAMHISRESFKS